MKMFLLVDIGNTRIKWNVYDKASGAFLLQPQSQLWHKEDLEDVLQNHWRDLKQISTVLLSSVAGKQEEQCVQHWLQNTWQLQATVITTEHHAFGVSNGYEAPAQLGVDRWLSLLAAHRLTSNDVCVVDCGTAMTVDTVTKSGKHLGGLIAPGAQLMQSSLIQGTHGVKINHATDHITPFSRSTSLGVKNGALLAAVGFVDRTIRDIESQLGQQVDKIITGGDAVVIAENSQYKFHHEPELVLKGLARYAGEIQ